MTITLNMRGEFGLITIDDGNKNVINHQVLDALEQAWEQAEADASVVILNGRKGSFCAGYDINVMIGDDPQAAGRLGRRGGLLAHKIFGSGKPTIAVAPGHAFTIGALWLACCDVRIGEQGNFKYGMSEVALGVPLAGWPMELLKARLNQQHLIPAALHSRTYNPAQALQAGFIDELVPAGKGIDTAIATAGELARLPGDAYAITKQQMRSNALATMAADLNASSA